MGALLWSFFKMKIREGTVPFVNRIILALGIASVALARKLGVAPGRSIKSDISNLRFEIVVGRETS
jgi:hypothetical protein